MVKEALSRSELGITFGYNAVNSVITAKANAIDEYKNA